jgi:uncharacterized integral membrane protein (TIGR00697 family)
MGCGQLPGASGLTSNGSPQRAVGASPYFVAIVALFITCLITANIISVKLITFLRWDVPAGVVIFPLAYIVGDVLTEVYGYSTARRVIWLGFACNLLAVGAIALAGALPAPDFWNGQAAYDRILGYTPRLLAASFAAYLVGEFANAAILARMKLITRGRFLWTRTIGSTIVGEGLDSLVFITIAFAGTVGMDASALRDLIVTQWLIKVGYETIATPLTYIVVDFLKRAEGQDARDAGTNFNPFAFGGDRGP